MTLVLTAVLLQGIGAQAATLDKDTCTRLEEEQTTLEKAGVRATLVKGAAWAKVNLPLDKLLQQAAAAPAAPATGAAATPATATEAPPASNSVDVRSRENQRGRDRDSR